MENGSAELGRPEGNGVLVAVVFVVKNELGMKRPQTLREGRFSL